MRRKISKVITGLIVATSVIGGVASTAFATTGDNPVTADVFKYKYVYDGSVIRVDCMPGYTQTTSKSGTYSGAYKEAKYVAAGINSNGKYYSTAKEHVKSINTYVCIYTLS